MRQKLKIAFVNKFFFLKGGSEKVMFDEANILEHNGHETAFFSMHHPQNPGNYKYSEYFVDYIELSNIGKEYSLLEKLKIIKNIIYNKQAAVNFEKFINDFKPDIIHCHNISSQISPSILRVAKKYNVPAVITMHDCQFVCPNYLLMKSGVKICEGNNCARGSYIHCFLNKCVKNSYSASLISALQMYFNRFTGSYTEYTDKFISPSNFLRNKVMETGLAKEKTVFIPNFVNIDEYTPEHSNYGYFLYAGRLSFEKGVNTLLNSFKKLPEARLKIAGTGPLEKELVKFTEQNNMNNVEFLGYQTGEALKESFKNCKALIIPSECYENAPMTVVEAFAYGKPVIGSNLGGIPEMVEHNKTGMLFEPKNTSELTNMISELNSTPEKVALLGRQARKKAEKLYNSSFHYEKLMELYNSLICLKKPDQLPVKDV